MLEQRQHGFSGSLPKQESAEGEAGASTTACACAGCAGSSSTSSCSTATSSSTAVDESAPEKQAAGGAEEGVAQAENRESFLQGWLRAGSAGQRSRAQPTQNKHHRQQPLRCSAGSRASWPRLGAAVLRRGVSRIRTGNAADAGLALAAPPWRARPLECAARAVSLGLPRSAREILSPPGSPTPRKGCERTHAGAATAGAGPRTELGGAIAEIRFRRRRDGDLLWSARGRVQGLPPGRHRERSSPAPGSMG